MKAIFINSKEKSVHYIELSTNSESRVAEMYDRLECKCFTVGASFPYGDVLFVDDEGLLSLTEESMFFQLDNFQILAGNGLIIGPEINFENGTYTVDNVQTEIELIKVEFFTRNQLQKIL